LPTNHRIPDADSEYQTFPFAGQKGLDSRKKRWYNTIK